MALASARISWQATDILSMMSACNLYAGYQAWDLRALHMAFKDKAVCAILAVTWRFFASNMATGAYETLQGELGAQLSTSWDKSAQRDLRDRWPPARGRRNSYTASTRGRLLHRHSARMEEAVQRMRLGHLGAHVHGLLRRAAYA